MNDRGMKKWAPYKSLNEQEKYLATMERAKHKISKPQISESKAEEINNLLVNYQGQQVVIRFYWDGFIKETRGVIDKIDTFYNLIKINDIKIGFSSIVDLY